LLSILLGIIFFLEQKGKIYKGSNDDAYTLNTFGNTKMIDLMVTLSYNLDRSSLNAAHKN